MRDLSICRFWCLWGSWNKSPEDVKGQQWICRVSFCLFLRLTDSGVAALASASEVISRSKEGNRCSQRDSGCMSTAWPTGRMKSNTCPEIREGGSFVCFCFVFLSFKWSWSGAKNHHPAHYLNAMNHVMLPVPRLRYVPQIHTWKFRESNCWIQILSRLPRN